MYSDEYIPGTRLSKENIQEVYEKEVLKIVKNGAYMGIWQVLALSNVLQLPVFSVYPHLGNTIIRTDLHRLILPRVCAEENAMKAPLVIMWTTTRCDMNVTHWVPNQFEPALPNAPQLETDISDANADQNTLEEKPDTPEMKTKKMKPSTPEIKLHISGMKMDTPDKKPGAFAMNPDGKMDTSTPEMNPGAPEIVVDISAELDELTLKTSVPKEAQNKPDRSAYCIAPDVPPPEQCLGQ